MGACFNDQSGHVLTVDKWQQLAPTLQVGFTTREQGFGQSPYNAFNLGLHVGDQDSVVLKNRQLLAENIDMPLETWVVGEQVHGNGIAEITSADKGKGAWSLETAVAGVDGLTTDVPGIMLAAFYADCVPLFFFDCKTSRIGIAHAGWKGTVKEIAGQMVHHFRNSGTNMNDLHVLIGPSISQEAYEVDQHVMDAIPPDRQGSTIIHKENGHGLLDLKQLNMEILLNYGVLRHNIGITEYCTFRDEHLFFSHRRAGGPTGRMLGFIGYSV